MSTIDVVEWGGTDRLTNLENFVKNLASQTTIAPAPSGDTSGALDSANLQAALNAAAGGVLTLKAGTYFLNQTLTYSGTKPVAIIGLGKEESGGITKIKAASGGSFTQVGTTGFNAVISIANASNVNHFRFENFYVDMTGFTNTIGLYLDQVGYSRCVGLKFREGAIGIAGLRVSGDIFDDCTAWNQATYGFAHVYTDGAGGTGAGTVAVTTNGQGNSWRDCEYRMTSAVNNCTAGYAILSGQQDICFTNCHATRSIGVATGLTHGFLLQGPVSSWPPDGTWAGQVHMINCNADAVADATSGTGAGYTFKNYRHVRRTQCWDSAMDTTNGWYSPATIIDNCQDVVIASSEISSNGVLLKNNVDLCTFSANHFLNAGTNTTCINTGSATLTNLIFDVNNKKVAAALWFDNQQTAATAMNASQQMDRNVSGLITQAYQKLWLPTGAKGENFSRLTATGNQAYLSTGRMSMAALPLLGYEPISSLTFVSNATALSVGTHLWFALYDAALNIIRQSTDQLATAWGANTALTLTLDSLPVSAGSRSGTAVVTLTFPTLSTQTPLTSLIAVNDTIVVSNANIAAYNGSFTVTGVTSNTITYTSGGSATDSLAAPFPTVQLASSKRSFVPSQPAIYYAAVMSAATTVPTITGATIQTAVGALSTPVSGSSNSSLTGTAPSPASALSAQGANPYVYWA